MSQAAPAEPRPRTAIALDALENPIVVKALALWREARGDRAFPKKADLPPRAMLSFLKYTALLRVLDGDYLFRVVGDQITIQQGAQLQGKTTEEIDKVLPGHGSVLKRIYDSVVRARAPLAFRGWYLRPADRHPFCHEVVILPVSDDAERIDHLFVVAA